MFTDEAKIMNEKQSNKECNIMYMSQDKWLTKFKPGKCNEDG